jgi:hypothetical protein
MMRLNRYAVAFAVPALLAFAAPAMAAEKAPTFTKDVAPIFQEKCEACHRPDSIAPMSLVSYEEVRPWLRSIKARVAARQMPPWHLDRTVGIQKFKNDRSLTDDQLETIVRWIDTGAPKGDPKDMPAPKQWPNEQVWNFQDLFGGPPDLIIKSPAYTQKAGAQDAWWKPVVDTGLTEERWVRAIEMRPATVKGRRITHHATANLRQDEEKPGSSPAQLDGWFMEWAVGKQGEIMRAESGKLMLPGSKIVFDVHYSAVNEDITDSVELGIYLYPKGQTPKYRQRLQPLQAFGGGARNLDLPPNQVTVNQGLFVMPQAGRIENFQPHMHLRGKAMMFEAVRPNGQSEVLSYVDNFQFNWHNNYVYADDVAPLLPKGTILRVTSWHDNTASNRANPDPNQWVGWGDRTVDEMAHAWVNLTYFTDEQFEAEVAKRKAETRSTQQQ